MVEPGTQLSGGERGDSEGLCPGSSRASQGIGDGVGSEPFHLISRPSPCCRMTGLDVVPLGPHIQAQTCLLGTEVPHRGGPALYMQLPHRLGECRQSSVIWDVEPGMPGIPQK